MTPGSSRAEPRPPPGGRSGVKPIARFVLLECIAVVNIINLKWVQPCLKHV